MTVPSAESLRPASSRILIALGGNAMTGPDGSATWLAQNEAINEAMEPVAELIANGIGVTLTHGNGPQVGNLLTKNELSAHAVPPVPLDWCDAQTQATIGFTIQNALESALARRNLTCPTATVVTRTLVDRDDPGFAVPTKPVGRYLTRERAQPLIDAGQQWEDRGEKGWRRIVASPQPRQILDAPAVLSLIERGFVVVACGGGGIPVVRTDDGGLRGVEAVIDKDLTAAIFARAIEAQVLVIATDVEHAILGFGTPQQIEVGQIKASAMQRHADEGQFASGSMGPKVDAAIRFARSGGTAIITSLHRIADALNGDVGTVVVPDVI